MRQTLFSEDPTNDLVCTKRPKLTTATRKQLIRTRHPDAPHPGDSGSKTSVSATYHKSTSHYTEQNVGDNYSPELKRSTRNCLTGHLVHIPRDEQGTNNCSNTYTKQTSQLISPTRSSPALQERNTRNTLPDTSCLTHDVTVVISPLHSPLAVQTRRMRNNQVKSTSHTTKDSATDRPAAINSTYIVPPRNRINAAKRQYSSPQASATKQLTKRLNVSRVSNFVSSFDTNKLMSSSFQVPKAPLAERLIVSSFPNFVSSFEAESTNLPTSQVSSEADLSLELFTSPVEEPSQVTSSFNSLQDLTVCTQLDEKYTDVVYQHNIHYSGESPQFCDASSQTSITCFPSLERPVCISENLYHFSNGDESPGEDTIAMNGVGRRSPRTGEMSSMKNMVVAEEQRSILNQTPANALETMASAQHVTPRQTVAQPILTQGTPICLSPLSLLLQMPDETTTISNDSPHIPSQKSCKPRCESPQNLKKLEGSCDVDGLRTTKVPNQTITPPELIKMETVDRCQEALNQPNYNRTYQYQPHLFKFESNIPAPPMLWEVFTKQNAAMTHLKPGLGLFGNECVGPGRRNFIVTSPRYFWQLYEPMPLKRYYELIVEDRRCKLYFDLDLSRADPSQDQATLTSFLSPTGDYLREQGCEPSCICLTACTDQKFSYHVIYPKIILSGHKEAKEFVNKLLEKFPDLSNLIDTLVYSRNRNFRIFLSSKYGKTNPLLYDYYNSDSKLEKYEDVFFASLVSDVFTPPLPLSDIVNVDGGVKAETKPLNQLRLQKPLFGRTSTFPLIDAFIRRTVEREGGYIQSMKHFPKEIELDENIIYSIAGGYKFCGRIQRHHRSNNIMFIVLPHASVYYQKCYDKDCAGYRSEVKQLPDEIYRHLTQHYDFEPVLPSYLTNQQQPAGEPSETLPIAVLAKEKIQS